MNSWGVLLQAKRTSFGRGMDHWGNPRHQDGDLKENARGGDAKRRREMQPSGKRWTEASIRPANTKHCGGGGASMVCEQLLATPMLCLLWSRRRLWRWTLQGHWCRQRETSFGRGMDRWGDPRHQDGDLKEYTRRKCKEEKRDAAPLVDMNSSEALVQAKRTSFGCGMDRWGNPHHQDGI